MILVTGAAGRTGRAVIRAVAASGGAVRALVRRPEAAALCRKDGARETMIGDLESDGDMAAALAGATRVFHVGPPFSPAEETIGRRMIAGAVAAGVGQFVFHSVFHPQCRQIEHHRLKLAVEEALIESGLPYTILAPAMYMQNLAVEWPEIEATGKYRRAYSPQVRMAIVDLDDVAAAAARVLADDDYVGGSFELCSAPSLTHAEMADILAGLLGRPIVAEAKSIAEWRQHASARFSPAAMDMYAAMCRHYDAHGLPGGNAKVLAMILGRAPTDFATFAARFVAERRRAAG